MFLDHSKYKTIDHRIVVITKITIQKVVMMVNMEGEVTVKEKKKKQVAKLQIWMEVVLSRFMNAIPEVTYEIYKEDTCASNFNK